MAAKKATPEQQVKRFTDAGSKLSEAQWRNMGPRTRALFLEHKERAKPTVKKPDSTVKAGLADLKEGK